MLTYLYLHVCAGRVTFLRICIPVFHVISKLLHHYVCESVLGHANTYKETGESQQNKGVSSYFSRRLDYYFTLLVYFL